MLFQHLLKAIFAATVFAPSHNPRNAQSEEISGEFTNLGKNHQKEKMSSVIQGIRDGNIHAACTNLKTLKNARRMIPSIIHQAYGNEPQGVCNNVLDFIKKIDLKPNSTEPRDKMLTNFVKSVAYNTLLSILSKQIFSSSSEVSECVFRLAWEVHELWLTLTTYEWQTESNLRSVLLGLPVSVRDLILDGIHIRRNSTPCEDVNKDILGDYQKWRCESESFENETGSEPGGVYFTLGDTSGLRQPLEGDAEGDKVYLGQNDSFRNSSRLWKPILVSENKLQFEHKASGKYLSYVDVGPCYKYVLSDNTTDWFISNGV